MPEEYYDLHFPNLRKTGFRRTSEEAYYNCIAHAVHDENRKWCPGEYADWSDDYWPEGASRDESVAALVATLAVVGYAPCPDGTQQPGVEKAALYATPNGLVTHAARQEPDGTWRSKLGPDEDIEHVLEGLEGPLYGRVVAFLARPRPE